jgi:hypothetical protein
MYGINKKGRLHSSVGNAVNFAGGPRNISMRKIHTIAQSSHLYFSDHGYTEAERFVSHFREVWLAIPFNHRRSLTCHWRQLKTAWLSHPEDNASRAQYERCDWPCIEVVDVPPGRDGSLEALGCYCPAAERGAQPRLAFWAFAVNHMTANVLSALIAYVLAEAFVAAEDRVTRKPDWRYMLEKPEQWDAPENDGTAALHQMEEWGFKTSLLATWSAAHSSEIEVGLNVS